MRYESLTLERLKEVLNYDPATGVFTWRTRPYHNSRKKVGDVAGALKNGGYRYIGLDGHGYLASQLAWFYVHGRWAKGNVGVKNDDPSDVRIDNLVELNSPPGDHDLSTKEGLASYNKARRDAFPGAHREYGFQRYYGISLAEYQRMFVEQNGVCAICEQPEKAKTQKGRLKWLSVDHDHETGAVRALLCLACNHALGAVNDDPDILQKAADYIERHKRGTVVDFEHKDAS